MKMSKKGKWELVGNIGIDSGQVIIVDPCYLNNWIGIDKKLTHTRGIRKGNKSYQWEKDFTNFDEPLKSESGKTPNGLVEEGWEKWEKNPDLGKFSWNGICQLTMKNGFGQLENLAVGSRTGWGDGYYPVYAYVKESIVLGLAIDFDLFGLVDDEFSERLGLDILKDNQSDS